MRICARCSWVSLTLLGVVFDFDESSAGVQPASANIAAIAAMSGSRPAERERRTSRCSLVMVVSCQVGPVPPAAAKRLEQCGRVGEAARLRLHEIDPRLLI